MTNPNLIRFGTKVVEVTDYDSGKPMIHTSIAAQVLEITHRALLNRLKRRKVKLIRRIRRKRCNLFLSVDEMNNLIADADISALRDARYKRRSEFNLVDGKFEVDRERRTIEREIQACLNRYTYTELIDLLDITVTSDPLADGLTRVLEQVERVRPAVKRYVIANIKWQWELVEGRAGILAAEEDLRKALWRFMKPSERKTDRGIAMDMTKFITLFLGEYGCTIRCKTIPRVIEGGNDGETN